MVIKIQETFARVCFNFALVVRHINGATPITSYVVIKYQVASETYFYACIY